MRKSTSIVRTRTITTQNNKEDYFQIDLMTYENYSYKSELPRFYNEKFELYPYKWYDIRYLVDFPYYYLSLLFKTHNKNALNLNNTTSIAIRFTIFIIETSFVWFINNIIESIYVNF